MDYLLLIHNNADQSPTEEEWSGFFGKAMESGMFKGGSEFGASRMFGGESAGQLAPKLGGFMRFRADEPETLEELLAEHPVVRNGGSVELVELPVTS